MSRIRKTAAKKAAPAKKKAPTKKAAPKKARPVKRSPDDTMAIIDHPKGQQLGQDGPLIAVTVERIEGGFARQVFCLKIDVTADDLKRITEEGALYLVTYGDCPPLRLLTEDPVQEAPGQGEG